MTPEQEKAALQEAIKIQVKGLLDEQSTKFNDLIELHPLVKEASAIVKSMKDAKTIEEVATLKAAIAGFEAAALEKKSAKEKKEGKKLRNFNAKYSEPHKFFKALSRNVAIGLADLHSKGAFTKYKEKSIGGMTIYTSKHSIDDAGAKVDNPMSDATSVVPIGSGIAASLMAFEPGLTRVVRRKPFILNLVDLARTMALYISWMEQTNVDTGIAFSITQGAAGSGTYGSFRWTQAYQQVQNIQAMSKMTNELLADLASAQNEVQTEIIELLQLYVDSQVLKGNGSAPQLKGILQYAVAFSNFGSLAVSAPTNYDALIAAILQIRANGVKGGVAAGGEYINIFEPTDIVMHPADVTAMELTKDTLNRYVMQMFPDYQFGGKTLGGCKITSNINMTQGSFLVGDMTKSHVRIREDAAITLGYVNTDFQDNMITVKGRLRAAHYIKSNQTQAFVTDTFANAKAAIQAV
jgi:hypothetical protein